MEARFTTLLFDADDTLFDTTRNEEQTLAALFAGKRAAPMTRRFWPGTGPSAARCGALLSRAAWKRRRSSMAALPGWPGNWAFRWTRRTSSPLFTD